ncbi:MAG: NifU family protein [Candidatus Limnocylindrales bacterium]
MTVAQIAPDFTNGSNGQTGVEGSLDARQVAERVGNLLAEIGKIADPRLTERTEDLVSLLMRFYGAGIERIMEIADDAGLLEGALLDGLIQDELVSSMLVVHDLHPIDLATRVHDALERVRPYLGSHGGDVEIVRIEGDVVYLRMEGSCSTCPSSTVTLNYAIEKAILEAAPEISRIEADGVQAEPQAPLIQLQPRPGSSPVAPPTTRSEWITLEAAARPGPTGLGAVELAGMPVLICRSGNDLYAYRDRCPNCRAALDQGRLVDAVLTCKTCGHEFDVRLAGRSVGDATLHLEPLPLLTEGATVRIAVPVPVVVMGTTGDLARTAIVASA